MRTANRKTAFFNKKKDAADDNIIKLMIPSLMGIVLCMVCLAGVTWAWFTASVETNSTLSSANYDLYISISSDTAGIPKEPNGSYILEAGTEYRVELTASGTSTSGYCIVNGDGKELRTAQIAKGDTLEFTLIPSSSGAYKFVPAWGTYSGNADINGGDVVGNKAAFENSGALDESHGDMNSDINKPQTGIEDSSAPHDGGQDGDEEQTGGEDSGKETQQNITEEPSSYISQ